MGGLMRLLTNSLVVGSVSELELWGRQYGDYIEVGECFLEEIHISEDVIVLFARCSVFSELASKFFCEYFEVRICFNSGLFESSYSFILRRLVRIEFLNEFSVFEENCIHMKVLSLSISQLTRQEILHLFCCYFCCSRVFQRVRCLS